MTLFLSVCVHVFVAFCYLKKHENGNEYQVLFFTPRKRVFQYTNSTLYINSVAGLSVWFHCFLTLIIHHLFYKYGLLNISRLFISVIYYLTWNEILQPKQLSLCKVALFIACRTYAICIYLTRMMSFFDSPKIWKIWLNMSSSCKNYRELTSTYVNYIRMNYISLFQEYDIFYWLWKL